jgi:ABC-type multidrug transport system ATPase subunit
MREKEPIVTLEGVSTRVVAGREDHAALSEIRLSLFPGQVYALLGPKGAGKSDLLRLLAGRLMPLGGLVRYSPKLGTSDQARTHNIGYCAQRPELAPDLTVREHLQLFAAIAKLPESDREPRIARVAEQLNLADCMDQQVEGAPGGVHQRLHVALSMLHKPLLWLLDEPFVGLEDAAQTMLWRALCEHREQGGVAILVCTDLKRVEQHADQVLLLSRGRLVTQTMPAELIQRHGSLERAFGVLTGKTALN